jgi:hypothetical protein
LDCFEPGGGPLLPGRGLRGYLLVLVILAMAGPIVAADLFWVGESSDTNNPTSGTWTNSTLVAWSDGSSASANAAWTNGNSAIFGGEDGTYGIRVPAAISMVSARFAASGYTFTNSTGSTITGTGSPYWIIEAGKTNTIGTNITVNTGNVNLAIGAPTGNGAGGTLIVENSGSGGGLASGKGVTILGSNMVVLVRNGGKLPACHLSTEVRHHIF